MSSLYLCHSCDANLGLVHPTAEERAKIWKWTSFARNDLLPVPVFPQESEDLTTVPPATDAGMTYWILVDKRLLPNERPILCAGETLLKRAIKNDYDGNVKDVVVHGIASVSCSEEYRRRGYTSLYDREMKKVLRDWEPEEGVTVGSILYSDIGSKWMSVLGWVPDPKHDHLLFPSIDGVKSTSVQDILEGDIASLCERDEAMDRTAMGKPSEKRRFVIVPNAEHMLFLIRKGDLATKHLFDHIPKAKGCIAGSPGRQVWAIWYHRYYGHPDSADASNVLYIMRLVVEGDGTRGWLTIDSTERELPADQLKALESVIKAAQVVAAEWRLQHVSVWDSTPLVQKAIVQTGLWHRLSRRDDHITSGRWYDADAGVEATPEWITDEYYSL